jgi:hypothetical protein
MSTSTNWNSRCELLPGLSMASRQRRIPAGSLSSHSGRYQCFASYHTAGKQDQIGRQKCAAK